MTYTISPLGKVCRTAFKKCYGLPENKMEVLLKKIHLDNPSVESDQRGPRTPRKILPPVKNMVINFTCSHDRLANHTIGSDTDQC